MTSFLTEANATDPQGAWLNTTNHTQYLAGDGSHLEDDIGTEYFGRRIADKIKEAVK